MWVEFNDRAPAESLAERVGDELAAYDALALGRLSRPRNWLVVSWCAAGDAAFKCFVPRNRDQKGKSCQEEK